MPTLADIIGQQVRDAVAKAIHDAKGDLTDVAQAGGDAAGHGLLGDVGAVTGIIDNIVGGVIDIVGPFLPPLELVKQVEDNGGKLGTGFGLGYLLGYSAYQALNPIFLHLNHAVADLVQSEIFDPQTASQLEAKGIITNAYGRSEAAGGNLSGEHYDKLVRLAQTRPGAVDLADMFHRGIVTEQDYRGALQLQGYDAFWQDRLALAARNLLSVADVSLAELRGNIDTATAFEYARTLGYGDADFQVMIDNDGEPLGLEQMLEAYRRGFMDKQRLVRGIRQSRVRNEWIDVAEALRYSPMSTADAVRAVVENYLTDEQGQQIAEQNGLLPDHWRPLVDAFGRPLSHEQMMSLYYRGEVTIDEVRQAFRESDLKNKYIDHAIELGRRLIPERTIVSMLGHGVIDHPTAVDLLHQLGFNTDDAERLIKLGTAQRLAQHKALTKSELVAMYEDGLLNHATAVKHLIGIGYTSDDADTLLQLADVKANAARLKTLKTGVAASLKAHHITEQQAITQLEHAGIDSSQARQLVDQWLQQRGTVTKSLTESQVLALGHKGIITYGDTLARLQALGLAKADAELLMTLHNVTPQTQQLAQTTTPPLTPGA